MCALIFPVDLWFPCGFAFAACEQGLRARRNPDFFAKFSYFGRVRIFPQNADQHFPADRRLVAMQQLVDHATPALVHDFTPHLTALSTVRANTLLAKGPLRHLVARDKPKGLALLAAMHKLIQFLNATLEADGLPGPPCLAVPELAKTGRALSTSPQVGSSVDPRTCGPGVQRAFLDLQQIRSPESIETPLAENEGHMERELYRSLYQINTRAFLTELSRRFGRRATLDDIADSELDRLAALGFDWVWFLSVWQTGQAGQRISRSNPECRKEFQETYLTSQRRTLPVR